MPQFPIYKMGMNHPYLTGMLGMNLLACVSCSGTKAMGGHVRIGILLAIQPVQGTALVFTPIYKAPITQQPPS